MRLRWLIIILIVPFFSACHLFLPAHGNLKQNYVLQARYFPVMKTPKTNKTILVLATDSSGILNTKNMLYVKRPYQISFYAKHQWANPPEKFIAPQIILALQESNHFKAVVGAPIIGLADYRLSTKLLTLQQSFLTARSQVIMTLNAELIRGSTGKVIASRSFTATVAAPGNNPYSGVHAANQALTLILKQLVPFVVRHT